MEFIKKDGKEYVVLKGNKDNPPLVFGVCHNECCEEHSNIEDYPKDKPIGGMGRCKICGHVHDYS